MSEKWDMRFIDLAKHISQWSRDPSTKVGAVVAMGNRVISLGYNGFPRTLSDDEDIYLDRERKYKRVVHAELNAILFARNNIAGSTLYNWPFMPCCACAGAIIQTGICRVVAPTHDSSRWMEDWGEAIRMFEESHVKLDFIDV